MYGCETWSFTFREEHRPRVSENRVMRRIFERKKDKVIWEWGKLQGDTKKRELLKNPTKIEEIQEKKILTENETLQLAF